MQFVSWSVVHTRCMQEHKNSCMVSPTKKQKQNKQIRKERKKTSPYNGESVRKCNAYQIKWPIVVQGIAFFLSRWTHIRGKLSFHCRCVFALTMKMIITTTTTTNYRHTKFHLVNPEWINRTSDVNHLSCGDTHFYRSAFMCRIIAVRSTRFRVTLPLHSPDFLFFCFCIIKLQLQF